MLQRVEPHHYVPHSLHHLGFVYSQRKKRIKRILDVMQPDQRLQKKDDKNNIETNGRKAFLTTFSKALQAEYKSKGIIIQAVTPYGVSTPMTKNTSTNIITKSSMDFVKESLNHVTQGSETYGCLAHATLGLIMNNIPLWVIHSTKVQELFVRFFSSERKKE
ncbi:hypothetical protein AB205_0146380 [Aquarana catesbeiana]|uniref:Uncharacterized protein n=1 Tax=Aquarana catesbeiana TaxID=8400 RepID=A0A2G9S910_AQUCT|nr:hypothetical protein AB205_0146380 [Aquarana catesbeiana]